MHLSIFLQISNAINNDHCNNTNDDQVKQTFLDIYRRHQIKEYKENFHN